MAVLKKISLLLVLCLAVVLVGGCGGQESNDVEPAGGDPVSAGEQKDTIKVAIIFPGSIKDMGWNQSGYDAIMEAKDKYGIEVSHQETVEAGEARDVLRNYAADGYDLVIGHDLYYSDPMMEVAAEFPNTMFGISGGYDSA
jgi:basic membrane protein A